MWFAAVRSPIVFLFLGSVSAHLGLFWLDSTGMKWASVCLLGALGTRLLLSRRANRSPLLGAWMWGWATAAISLSARVYAPDQLSEAGSRTCEVFVGVAPMSPRGRANRLLVHDTRGNRWVLENSGVLRPGQRAWVVCRRRPPSLPWHPWDFDERAHWFGRGWRGAWVVDQLLVWSSEPSVEGRLLSRLDRLRSRSRDRLMPSRTEEDATRNVGGGLLLGLTTGDRSGMTRRVKDAFAGVGLAHLTAVSGFHVGLVVGLLSWALRRLGAGRRWSPLLSLPAVWGYVMICGASPSALRAAAMATVAAMVLSLGRRSNGIAILSLVGLLLLAVRPVLVHDLGARLSFLATFGILLWHETRPGPIRVWQAVVSIPLVATLFTLPAALPAFGQLPLAFLPANVVATPFTPLLSFLAFVLIILPEPAADFLSPFAMTLAGEAVHLVLLASDAFPPWTLTLHPVFLGVAGSGLALSVLIGQVRPMGWVHGMWGSLFFLLTLRVGALYSSCVQPHRLPSGDVVVHAAGRAAVHARRVSSGVSTWKTRTLMERVSKGPPLSVHVDSTGRVSWSDLALVARSPRRSAVFVSSPRSRCGSPDLHSFPTLPCP